MKPELVKINSFSVDGLSTRTKNSEEMNSATSRIGKLWDSFYKTDLARKTNLIYGVYSNYESNEHGLYTLTVGIKEDTPSDTLNYERVLVNAGSYIRFGKKGALPKVVFELWQEVWEYFSNESVYQRKFTTDFEDYSMQGGIDLYIAA